MLLALSPLQCVYVWKCSRPDRSLGVEYLGQGPHHLKLWFPHVVLCCAALCPQLHFAADAGEKPVEVFHRLKLYADDDPTGQTRKPVVSVGYALLLPSCPVCWHAVVQGGSGFLHSHATRAARSYPA